jgi:hypothetical protein
MVAAADRVKGRALVAVLVAGAVATAGLAINNRRDQPRPAEPLEQRAGYQEHKRACLDLQDERREARKRSCQAWQEMLAEERQRLAEVGGDDMLTPAGNAGRE